MIAQNLHVTYLDEKAFADSKEFLLNSLEVIADDPSALLMLEMLNPHADFLYAHSVSVSIYGVMIAKKLEWQSPQTLFKISLAGLFHDIGKKEIPREILEKARIAMSQAECKSYETHALRGKEIMGMLPSIPEIVQDVAAQHHENKLGTGFPLALRRNSIAPVSSLIAVTNKFCELVVKSPFSEGMSATEAVSQIQSQHVDEFEPEYFNALKK